MKRSYIIIMLIALLALNAQTLFEVKDASDNTVLEVSTDGLRIFNMGDTLMVISSTEIKAFIDANSKDRALSRSFSVSTNTTGKNDEGKMFRIAASDGAKFYNPDNNSDEILSINKGSIVANVNPSLNRDFVVNDEVSGKGAGNLMKISNKTVFETVDDSTMLWYKDKNAFRIGYVYITDPDNVGRGSFASGYRSQASGKFSSAIGYWAQAVGDNAFASGEAAWAIGENSVAIGKGANASGSVSSAIGSGTEASGGTSFAAGNNTEASGSNSCAIGGGARATGDYAISLGTGLTIASGYASTSIGSSTQATKQGAVALGVGSTSTGDYAVSMGRLNIASGSYSTAIGYTNDATGSYSTAIGYDAKASNTYSTAIGRYTEASGYGSTALGYYTDATGYYTSTLGRYTEARAYCSTVVGSYNTLDGSTSSWVSTDPIFVVGNGLSSTSRSDAMVVQKNGAVFIPDLYTATTTYSLKDLKVDSRGKLCVASKEAKEFSDEEIEQIVENNAQLLGKLEMQESRIKKLEESIEKLLNE